MTEGLLVLEPANELIFRGQIRFQLYMCPLVINLKYIDYQLLMLNDSFDMYILYPNSMYKVCSVKVNSCQKFVCLFIVSFFKCIFSLLLFLYDTLI